MISPVLVEEAGICSGRYVIIVSTHTLVMLTVTHITEVSSYLPIIHLLDTKVSD